MRFKPLFVAPVLLAGSLALPVAAAQAAPRAPHALQPEITTIDYQTEPGSVDGLLLAEELGFLGPLHVDVVGDQTGGPALAQAVATGQTAIGHVGTTALISAVVAGAPLRAVLVEGGINQYNSTTYYVLKSSPIHKAAQLIGQKVALNTLGAVDESVIDQYLFKAHLTKAQINGVQLTIVPGTNAAETLVNGDVAAAAITPAQAATLPNVRELFDSYQVYGKVNDDEWVMNPSFIAKYPNTTHILVAGLAKALLWQQTHKFGEVIAEYDKYLNANNQSLAVPQISFYRGAAVNSRAGVLKSQDITFWVSWMRKAGWLSASASADLKVSHLWTNKFNPYATGSNG